MFMFINKYGVFLLGYPFFKAWMSTPQDVAPSFGVEALIAPASHIPPPLSQQNLGSSKA